jgi:hypothetical protein
MWTRNCIKMMSSVYGTGSNRQLDYRQVVKIKD